MTIGRRGENCKVGTGAPRRPEPAGGPVGVLGAFLTIPGLITAERDGYFVWGLITTERDGYYDFQVSWFPGAGTQGGRFL